jgi:hypothetical protein
MDKLLRELCESVIRTREIFKQELHDDAIVEIKLTKRAYNLLMHRWLHEPCTDNKAYEHVKSNGHFNIMGIKLTKEEENGFTSTDK